jgi:L-fuconolactonase
MFGSDWPVCLLATTYDEVVEAARHTLGSLTTDELESVLRGCAVRVYRLPERNTAA